MKRMQCEVCGSNEFAKTNDGLFQCEYCGCKYTVEQAKTLISGAVEIVKGTVELNRLLENAEAFKMLGDYRHMWETYESLIGDYPNEIIVWESLLQAYYYILSNVNSVQLTGEPNIFTELQQDVEKAIKMCTNETRKRKIIEEYDNFCNNFVQSILEGKFDIIKSCTYYGFMPKAFNRFIASFPGAKEILDISNKNINAIKEANIYPDNEKEWRVNVLKTEAKYVGGQYFAAIPKSNGQYLFGRWYIYLHRDSDGSSYAITTLNDVFDVSNVEMYRKEAYTTWNRMEKCPLCWRELEGFRGRKCKRCNRTFSIIK